MDNLENLVETMNEQCLNKDDSSRIKWSIEQLQQDFDESSYYCCGYGRGAELCDVCRSTLKELMVYKCQLEMPQTIRFIKNELNKIQKQMKTLSFQLQKQHEMLEKMTK